MSFHPPYNLPHHQSYQRNAIWETLFALDTLTGLANESNFRINENNYPSMSNLRLSLNEEAYYLISEQDDHEKIQDYDDHHNKDGNAINEGIMTSVFDSHDFNISSQAPRPPPERFNPTSSKRRWQDIFSEGLTHTVTKSIPAHDLLPSFMAIPGARYPLVRLYYIIRKFTRWNRTNKVNHHTQFPFGPDSNVFESSSFTSSTSSLPKLTSLYRHVLNRQMFHEALIEWYDSLEHHERLVDSVQDWIYTPHFRTCTYLQHENIFWSFHFWMGISLLHQDADDDEIYSASLAKSRQSSLMKSSYTSPSRSSFMTPNTSLINSSSIDGTHHSTSLSNYSNTCSTNTTSSDTTTGRSSTGTSSIKYNHLNSNNTINSCHSNNSTPPFKSYQYSHYYPYFEPSRRYFASSPEWCILSFRSLIRLILYANACGDHPIVYGISLPYCIYACVQGVILRHPLHSYQSSSAPSSTSSSTNSLWPLFVKEGISVNEVIDGIQRVFIPFCTEISKSWTLSNHWISKMKRIVNDLSKYETFMVPK